MAFELVYTGTGSKGGIRPNSRGYCTVAHTRGMPVNYVELEENLCRYRSIYGVEDANYAKNPVACQHFHLVIGGQRLWHLSRTGVCGDSVTGRNNYVAHCLLLSASEVGNLPGGPAATLLHERDSLRATEWDQAPLLFPAQRRLSAQVLPDDPQLPTWDALAGDAGWAGVLAQSTLPSSPPCVILFDPMQHSAEVLLRMINEAMTLLPAAKRWDVTFSTYLRGAPPRATQDGCLWRFCPVDAVDEARQAAPKAPVIDLTRPGRCGIDAPLVECARQGCRPDWAQLLASHAAVRPVATPPSVTAPRSVAPTAIAPAAGAVKTVEIPDFPELVDDRRGIPNVPIIVAAAIALVVIAGLAWLLMSGRQQADPMAVIRERQEESRRQHHGESVAPDDSVELEAAPLQGGDSQEAPPAIAETPVPTVDEKPDMPTAETPPVQLGAFSPPVAPRPDARLELQRLLRPPNSEAPAADGDGDDDGAPGNIPLADVVDGIPGDLRICDMRFFRNHEQVAFTPPLPRNPEMVGRRPVTLTAREGRETTKLVIDKGAITLDLGEWPDYALIPLDAAARDGQATELVVFLPARLDLTPGQIAADNLHALLQGGGGTYSIHVSTDDLTSHLPSADDLRAVFIHSLTGPGNAQVWIRYDAGQRSAAGSLYTVPFTARIGQSGNGVDVELLPAQSDDVRAIVANLRPFLASGSLMEIAERAAEDHRDKIRAELENVEALLRGCPIDIRQHPDCMESLRTMKAWVHKGAQEAHADCDRQIRQAQERLQHNPTWTFFVELQDGEGQQRARELAAEILARDGEQPASISGLESYRKLEQHFTALKNRLEATLRDLEGRTQPLEQKVRDAERTARRFADVDHCPEYLRIRKAIHENEVEIAELKKEAEKNGSKILRLEREIRGHQRRLTTILRGREPEVYEQDVLAKFREADDEADALTRQLNALNDRIRKTRDQLAHLREVMPNPRDEQFRTLIRDLTIILQQQARKQAINAGKTDRLAAVSALGKAVNNSISESKTDAARERLFDIQLRGLQFQVPGAHPRLSLNIVAEPSP